MEKLSTPAVALITLGFLSACSSGGGSGSDSVDSVPDGSVVTDSSVPGTQQPPPNDDADSNNLVSDGRLLPVLLATQTDLDLEYAQSGVDIIERLSDSFILPADIDVFFADCGIANAFYVPPSFLAFDLDIDNENTQDLPPEDASVTQQPRSAGGLSLIHI